MTKDSPPSSAMPAFNSPDSVQICFGTDRGLFPDHRQVPTLRSVRASSLLRRLLPAICTGATTRDSAAYGPSCFILRDSEIGPQSVRDCPSPLITSLSRLGGWFRIAAFESSSKRITQRSADKRPAASQEEPDRPSNRARTGEERTPRRQTVNDDLPQRSSHLALSR
jgi:hypothetical protein